MFLHSSCLCIPLEGKAVVSKQQGKPGVSADTLVSLLRDLWYKYGVYPLSLSPCLVCCRHKLLETAAAPCFGCVRSVGKNLQAGAAAAAWGFWSFGINCSKWTVSQGWHVFGFYVCFSLGEPHGWEFGQPTTRLDGFSLEIVVRWLGALLSQSPEGSVSEACLGLHLPSCSCFPSQECFEVALGFEAACLG